MISASVIDIIIIIDTFATMDSVTSATMGSGFRGHHFGGGHGSRGRHGFRGGHGFGGFRGGMGFRGERH